MMSQVRNRSLTALAKVSVLGLALCAVSTSARADQWDKKTILTVNQPIQVRNTYLEPGTYVFKLLDSQSDRHVVQIFNSDQSRIIDTVMAVPNYRLQPTGTSRFAFWETAPGTAKALRAWFYPGDNYGQEFPLSKNLRRVEVASLVTKQTTTTDKLTTSTDNMISTTTEPATELEYTPGEAAAETSQVQPRVEAQVEDNGANDAYDYDKDKDLIAQNVTPEPPQPVSVSESEGQTTPAQDTQAMRKTDELPKTASPYPLFGLLGLASLGLYGVLRSKQSS